MTSRTRLLAVLWAAGAVSVTCNILAADPTAMGRGVAAWPPVALLLVVEVLARSPLPAGRLRWVAGLGAGSVAVTAAIASFHHMHEVAGHAGESQVVAWLFPLTVDGLAVVASVALVGTHAPPRPADAPASVQAPAAVDPPPDGLELLEVAAVGSGSPLGPVPRDRVPTRVAMSSSPGPIRFGPSSAPSSNGVGELSSHNQGEEL